MGLAYLTGRIVVQSILCFSSLVTRPYRCSGILFDTVPGQGQAVTPLIHVNIKCKFILVKFLLRGQTIQALRTSFTKPVSYVLSTGDTVFVPWENAHFLRYRT